MNPIAIEILLLKVSLVAALALAVEPLLHRRGAALRHLLCATALVAVLAMPLTLLVGPRGTPIPMPGVFRLAVAAAGTAAGRSSANLALFRILAGGWLVGAAAMLLRLALGHAAVASMMRRASQQGREGRVPVLAAAVSTPVVTGLFRPAILVPQNIANWSQEHRDAAFRHELAHVERMDLWSNLMAHVACSIYWFHPLVWLLARRMRALQELACDDAVLSSGFAPVVYAEALVAVAGQFTPTSLIGCHMLTEKTLKSRIARLLDGSLPRVDSKSAIRRAAAIFAATALCIGLANALPQDAGPQQTPATTGRAALKIGPGITLPKVLAKVEPTYTEEARAAKISGTVTLKVIIGTDGKAHEINVVDTPDAGLGLKAVEAVQQWEFQPASKEGQPVDVFAQIEVNFKLL